MPSLTPDTVHGHRLFTTLDGMRFVAALLIIPRHVPLFGELSFPESFLAVDLFFVLSGFVIANAYECKLLNGMNAVEFLRIRATRLYPLYCLGIALGTCAALTDHRFVNLWLLASHTMMSLLLIPNGTTIIFPLNIPAWSLFLEIFVNTLYVVALRRLVGRSLIAVIVAAALALIGFVAFHHSGDATQHSLDHGWTLMTLPFGVARVVFSFYIGVLIHRLQVQPGTGNRSPTLGNTAPWLLVAGAVAALACRFPPSLASLFELLVVTCVFSCLVIAGIRFQPTGISTRIFRLGGLSSYAIYVVHEPLGRLVISVCEAIPGLDIQQYIPWAGLVFVIALVPVCLALDAFYDAPVRRALGRSAPMAAGQRLAATHDNRDRSVT